MPYDHYEEVEELISMLENTSLQHYRKALQNAIDEGATGTEIFMALRWNIERLLAESSVDHATGAKAKKLLSELDNALR